MLILSNNLLTEFFTFFQSSQFKNFAKNKRSWWNLGTPATILEIGSLENGITTSPNSIHSTAYMLRGICMYECMWENPISVYKEI